MLARLLRRALSRSAGQASDPQRRRGHAPHDRPLVVFLSTIDRVCFIPDDPIRSRLASTRLRTLIPGGQIAGKARVALAPWSALVEPAGFAALGAPAVLVVAKLSTAEVLTRRDEVERGLERLSALRGGVRVVADVSDDYAAMAVELNQPFLEAYERGLAETCTLTVPCAALADRLRPIARHGVRVIEDPWESPQSNPAAVRGRDPLELLWFGNLTNADVVEGGLRRALPGLLGRRARIEVVTGRERSGLVAEIAERLTREYPAVSVRFVEWSPEAVWAALGRCDLVLLPQDHRDAWGSVKSHNRLVEAIRAGRFAVASPIPSYTELADYAWVGEDLAEGLAWALAHPRAAEQRVAAGQAYIATRFAPEVVGRKWAEVLGLEPASEATAPAPAGQGRGVPLRLNLGCGDKILPGYVNVDVAPARAGRPPDVICDLRKLGPFAADVADEVLAVHVVEHFWRWEVVAVLREWLRVLKPGGRMVVECPNLLTACEELLRDPVRAAGPGPEGQRTMWVFYGDPGWRDPLMCHRWNYTPQSLRALLEEAGLVNVRQEPAQFKLREPRDMRIVGEKPGGG
jgi:glycosyltransferase involved in cell wall biosynthesis